MDTVRAFSLADARDYMVEQAFWGITVADAARQAGYSEFHFLRLFEQQFRESPHEFLTRLRVERAKRLVRTSQLSMSEICHEVGYESQSSFSHLFLRETGYRPTEFRRVFSTEGMYALKVTPACFFAMRFPQS